MFKMNAISLSLQTINAQLYPDEKILIAQDGVGLYDGSVGSSGSVPPACSLNPQLYCSKNKSPLHANGRAHLTTHRILYLDALSPHSSSLAIALSLVRQTEFWTGFLKSSAKITLLLGDAGEPVRGATSEEESATREFEEEQSAAGERNWLCRVCGMRNVRGGAGGKCTLCGVARDPITSTAPSRSATPALRSSSSTSNRATQSPSPSPTPPTPSPTGFSPSDTRITCPTCTFLNHPSMSSCEVCDAPLSSPLSPPSRPSTPARGPTNTDAAPFVKLSFRKGGEKPFYAALKAALVVKAWEGDGAVVAAKRKDGVGIGQSCLFHSFLRA